MDWLGAVRTPAQTLMTRRYFVTSLPETGGLVGLPEQEAQHAARVMRVQVGDLVTLFDGAGNEAEAQIAAVGRKSVECTAAARQQVDREPSRAVQLGIALPKPDRARELIERLTEIGVQTVTPLIASRSQRPPSPSVIQKLRRGVIEACKQSGRNQLMLVEDPISADTFFRAPASGSRLIAHPVGASTDQWLMPSETVAVAIGPEGGWTEDEVTLARQNGFAAIHLGQRIYRIETAATVIAARLVDG